MNKWKNNRINGPIHAFHIQLQVQSVSSQWYYHFHVGCTADVAAAEALRSVRSFYGHKANNQEFLNYVNRVSNTLSANGQVNTTQSTAAGIGYQYNPHYGMVPSHISNIYYGSHPNVDTTAMYNQQLLSQSNSACSSNALLSGISIKPPSIPKPQAPPSVPIHPSQYKQQSNAAQNHAKLPKDVNTANTSSAITDWVYKIFSVHVTEKSSKKWNMAVTNFLNHKIDYWKSHNITPTPVDLMIPSADVIESYSGNLSYIPFLLMNIYVNMHVYCLFYNCICIYNYLLI